MNVYTGLGEAPRPGQQLKSLGWFPVRQGKHEIFGRVDRETTIPVPRHAEIPEFTARAILRKAQEV